MSRKRRPSLLLFGKPFSQTHLSVHIFLLIRWRAWQRFYKQDIERIGCKQSTQMHTHTHTPNNFTVLLYVLPSTSFQCVCWANLCVVYSLDKIYAFTYMQVYTPNDQFFPLVFPLSADQDAVSYARRNRSHCFWASSSLTLFTMRSCLCMCNVCRRHLMLCIVNSPVYSARFIYFNSLWEMIVSNDHHNELVPLKHWYLMEPRIQTRDDRSYYIHF